MSYIVNLAKRLTDINFNMVNGLSDSQNITELSKFVTFARQEGHIYYGIGIINCDACEDYKAYSKLLSESFGKIQGNKIFISLFISSNANEELIEFAKNDIEDYNAQFINIKWLADTQNQKIIVNGSQPDNILNIRQALISAFDNNDDIIVNSSELKAQAETIAKSHMKCSNVTATYVFMAINLIFWTIMYTPTGNQLIELMWLDKSLVSEGQIYRLFTYMFTHGGFAHFLCNTFTLFIIGSRLEKYTGHLKFVILYIASGIIAAIASCIAAPYGVAVGASGAIFGIIGGLIYIIKRIKHSVGGFDYSVAVMYAIVGIGSGFMMENIDNFAHIGGLIGGLIIAALIKIEK